MSSQKPTLSANDALAARLSRMQRLQDELDAGIRRVDQHRRELERIKREAEEITRTFNKNQQ